MVSWVRWLFCGERHEAECAKVDGKETSPLDRQISDYTNKREAKRREAKEEDPKRVAAAKL